MKDVVQRLREERFYQVVATRPWGPAWLPRRIRLELADNQLIAGRMNEDQAKQFAEKASQVARRGRHVRVKSILGY